MSAELTASRHNATLILTLSNPTAKNALHPDMYGAAIEALSTAERDDSIRVVVLTGENHFFCSGGNLHRLQENRDKDRAIQEEAIEQLNGWVEALRNCTKPVIAAVDGAAAGAGFSLALACDLIVAGSSAKFLMAYVKVGLTPDGGATWFLRQALPRQLATEVLIEGKVIGTQRLYDLGLVNRVVADKGALDAALVWADELADLSPNAVTGIKGLVGEAEGNSLSAQLLAEKRSFVNALHHPDSQEGIAAFLEKRKPQFQ